MTSRSLLDGSRGLSSSGKNVVDRRTGGAVRGEGAALLQHGQNLYQQGNFQAAIEAFSEALKDKDCDALSVLDSRAAAHSKLAQHDLALRDTKQMIKGHKNDERGYLRCGKTLLLDGKPDKALEVYAYGLRSLSKSNPRRQMVEQLHNKLRDKLSENHYDPFSILPLEVATMVLRHFDYKELVGMLRVSKKWNQFLTLMRDLWTHMDLSDAYGKLHWTSVRACIRRSRGMLTHAVVKNISSPSMQRVIEFMSRCPYLEHFEFRDTFEPRLFCNLLTTSPHLKRLRTFVVSAHTQVPQEMITYFLTTFPLERLEIHASRPSRNAAWPSSLPSVRSLTFGSGEPCPQSVGAYVPSLYVPALEPNPDPDMPFSMHNLEELRLDWYGAASHYHRLDLAFDKVPHLRRLDLRGVIFSNIGQEVPPNLEFLRFHTGIANLNFPSPPGPLFQNLKTLIFSDVTWLIDMSLRWFLDNTSFALRVLWLDSCLGIANPLGDLIKSGYFNNLTELNVSRIRKVDDTVAKLILENMLELKVLYLSFTAVTGRTVKMFADALASEDTTTTKIERLHLSGCEAVSSDAVTYGRERGIDIFTGSDRYID